MPKIDFQVNTQPTIDALLNALDSKKADSPRRYLGASSIGDECKRKLWYSLRWFSHKKIPAKNRLAILDGFEQEKRMYRLLNQIPGVRVSDSQLHFRDFNGFFQGHIDGIILGVIEAPRTKHIWEHKSCNEKKFSELQKLLAAHDQKDCLALWDETYFAQAQIYMHYFECKRHFLTVSSPGGRNYISVRTNYDKKIAERLIAKAREIIKLPEPPARAYKTRNYYKCNWCEHQSVCWDGYAPVKNCRTCLHSSPSGESKFECALHVGDLGNKERRGCSDHFFIPAAIAGEQVSAETENGEIKSIIYRRMRDGELVSNRKGSGMLKVIE